MEQYYEQNVVNKNIDERMKRTKTLTVIQTVCLILGVIVLVSSATLIQFFWIFLILSVPFFVAMFIVSRINKRNNTEYDYVIDDENIKISEIYFRQRRKLKHTIMLRTIESVGVFDSEGYKKIEGKATKKLLALVNYDDEKSVVYVLYNTNKGYRIMFIEPDHGFIIAMRRVLSAITVFDKSMSELERRIAEQERLTAMIEDDEDDDTEEDEAENDVTNAEESDDTDDATADTDEKEKGEDE